MISAKRVLLLGGIAIALVGMTHGLWYAVFAEHQALDGIGASLASSFSAAAERNPAQLAQAMGAYRMAKYTYDRQVDAHSHWIGLAMVLIALAIAFDHVAFSEKRKLWLALWLTVGSALFPLGVLLQTMAHGAMPKAIAALGSVLVITGLAGAIAGVLRPPAGAPLS
jgi:dipeptide/tripeptide permease